MPHRSEKPHVSAALARLRHGITLAALLVCLCALTQLMVFGFVHYTQVRYDKTEHAAASQALSVIPGHAGAPAVAHDTNAAQAAAPDPEAPASFRPLSPWDPSLHIISDLAVSVGVIATVMLAVLSLLGVAIAGGGAVPGVDKAVSAACWSLALALACIPWRDVLFSMPFPGVFSSYDAMTALSQSVDAGEASLGRLLAMYLVMPLAAVGVSLLSLSRFRAGVAEGIILTCVSELDERLERELQQIRARGVSAGTPRAVAALNEAIGEKPPAPSMPIEPDLSSRVRQRQNKRGIPGFDRDDDSKRPI